MARGGYRDPGPGQPPSGPGRFSHRTDGNQPNRVPRLAGSDLQYGDVGRLAAAQGAVPLPNAAQPAGGGPGGGPVGGPPPPLAAPGGQGSGGLPPFVTDTPSGRPGEPITEGMAMGPGGGPELLSAAPQDDREAVLQYLATTYGNNDALEMLREMRGAASAAPAGPGAPMPTAAPTGQVGASGSPPLNAGGEIGTGPSLDSMLLGDETEPAAPQPVEEAQEPQGPAPATAPVPAP